MADREAKKPMAKDTIFRMYSMTKPVICVVNGIFFKSASVSPSLTPGKRSRVCRMNASRAAGEAEECE